MAAAAGKAPPEAAASSVAGRAAPLSLAADGETGCEACPEEELVSEAELSIETVGGDAATGAEDEPRAEVEGEAAAAAVAGPGCRSPPARHAGALPSASAAATAGLAATKQPPLTPPPSLVLKWQRGSTKPCEAALRLLRPGAAAMLHAVLVRRAAPGCPTSACSVWLFPIRLSSELPDCAATVAARHAAAHPQSAALPAGVARRMPAHCRPGGHSPGLHRVAGRGHRPAAAPHQHRSVSMFLGTSACVQADPADALLAGGCVCQAFGSMS